LVVEAEAIAETRVGELLIGCLEKGRNAEQIENKFGFNPIESIRRVAIGSSGLVMDGDFSSANFEKIYRGFNSSEYGDNGTIFSRKNEEEAGGIWNNEIFFHSEKNSIPQKAIDVLEGREVYDDSLISEYEAYSEIYGRLNVSDVLKIIPDENSGIRDKFASIVKSVVFHTDVDSDSANVVSINNVINHFLAIASFIKSLAII